MNGNGLDVVVRFSDNISVENVPTCKGLLRPNIITDTAPVIVTGPMGVKVGPPRVSPPVNEELKCSSSPAELKTLETSTKSLCCALFRHTSGGAGAVVIKQRLRATSLYEPLGGRMVVPNAGAVTSIIAAHPSPAILAY
jgi:hypothetical protein